MSAAGENGGLVTIVVLTGGIDRAGWYAIYPWHLVSVSTASTTLIQSRYICQIIRGIVASRSIVCVAVCFVGLVFGPPEDGCGDKRADGGSCSGCGGFVVTV